MTLGKLSEVDVSLTFTFEEFVKLCLGFAELNELDAVFNPSRAKTWGTIKDTHHFALHAHIIGVKSAMEKIIHTCNHILPDLLLI